MVGLKTMETVPWNNMRSVTKDNSESEDIRRAHCLGRNVDYMFGTYIIF